MARLISPTELSIKGNLNIPFLKGMDVSFGLMEIATKALGEKAVLTVLESIQTLKMEMYFKGSLRGTITIMRTSPL